MLGVRIGQKQNTRQPALYQKEVRMKHEEAKTIVSNDWSELYPAGQRLDTALEVLGMSREKYDTLKRVARKTERRFPRRFIPTPTGSGQNR
jgi:hypothetical protein